MKILALLLLLQRISVGDTPPPRCTVGDIFHKSGTSIGVYDCSPENTWTLRLPITSTAVDAANLTTGIVAPSRLGSGTPNGTKFLRDDSTWQAIAGGGDLLAENNLSDLLNKATARANLQLGTLATQNGSVPVYVVLTATRTNATTSFADITDLAVPVLANTRYEIECRFVYAANATTTGIGIGWVGPASPTLTGGVMTSGLTGATVGGTTIIGNDNGGTTTASVATSGNFATFKGFWLNGANAGNVQMRFKSEVQVAAAIVIQPGSYCKYNTF